MLRYRRLIRDDTRLGSFGLFSRVCPHRTQLGIWGHVVSAQNFPGLIPSSFCRLWSKQSKTEADRSVNVAPGFQLTTNMPGSAPCGMPLPGDRLTLASPVGRPGAITQNATKPSGPASVQAWLATPAGFGGL